MAFRLKLIPTLFTIPAIVTLLTLGTWQLDRMIWKEDLILLLDQRTSAGAISLPEDTIVNQADHEFMPVTLMGHFDHDNEVLLLNRTHDKKAGMHVLTPFIRHNGQGAILVDRGWVPFENPGQDFRPDSQLEGEVMLEGVIRFPIGQTPFVPDNVPAKKQWYFIDLDKLGEIADYSYPDYYIMASKQASDAAYPVAGQWKLTIPNNHLEYAITWYSLAFILIVIFILFHREKTKS